MRLPAEQPTFDVRHLAVLCAVARTGSFAAAAASLSFTPSAVSQQMAKLERDAGTSLFHRHPHGACLTEAGEVLQAHAESLLAGLADARDELSGWSSGRRGPLRMGSFPTGTAAFGATALRSFGTRFADLAVHLVDGEPYESARRLKARELDLAVLFEFDHWPASMDYSGQPICGASELRCVDLFDDPFLVVMREDDPLAALQTLTPGELHARRIIGSPTGCPPWGADLQRACAQAGAAPQFEDHFETVDFQAVQALVAAGWGMSLIPRLALQPLRDGLCARPLAGAPVRHVRVARLAQAITSVPCTAMIEVLRLTTAHLRDHTEVETAVAA